jgi:hypothetical protein
MNTAEPSFYDEEIRKLYEEDRMTMKGISKKLHIAVGKVYNRLKYMGVHTRKNSDYPVSEKVRETWREIGRSRKGYKMTDAQKKKMSIAAKERFMRKGHGTRFLGGIRHRSDGYIGIYMPFHPNAASDGYVMEHRLVMERCIGRYLCENEVVHHINYNRSDNRIENLKLMTASEHMSLHMKERYKHGRNGLSIR